MSDKLPPKILILESDQATKNELCNILSRDWFEVLSTKSEDSALKIGLTDKPSLLIIGSLKKITSTLMLKKLRSISTLESIPVIFILDKYDQINFESERHTNYMIKPIVPTNLTLLIKKMLRDTNHILEDRFLMHKEIKIDLANYRCTKSGKRMHLRPIEFRIMYFLMKNLRRTCSRDEIIKYVWGSMEQVTDRTVDVHINRIRNLIKTDSRQYSLIKTVRADGYCLE